MKKTLSINLSGLVFTIDEDAYNKLQTYLHKLSEHFKDESDREIISDVETRIAEIFTERLNKNRTVVTLEDVDYVIEPKGYERYDEQGNRVFGEGKLLEELDKEEVALDKNILEDIKIDTDEIADISDFEYKAPTPESINKEYKNYTNQSELDDLYNSKQWEGKQRHEIYQSVEAKQYTDELAEFGMLSPENTEKFINMPIEKQEAYIKKARDYRIAKELGTSMENVSKMLEAGYEYFCENLMKHKKLTPEQKQNALDILKKYEEVDAHWFGKRDKRKRRMTSTSNIAKLQSDKDVFERKNGVLHKEYIPARTTDEIFAKVQKQIDDYSEKAERAKIQLQKKVEVNNVNTKLSKKEMVELLGKNGVDLKGVDTNNIKTLRGLIESNNINIASTVSKKNFDNAVDVVMREIFGKNLKGKGRNNTYKKLKKIIACFLIFIFLPVYSVLRPEVSEKVLLPQFLLRERICVERGILNILLHAFLLP